MSLEKNIQRIADSLAKIEEYLSHAPAPTAPAPTAPAPTAPAPTAPAPAAPAPEATLTVEQLNEVLVAKAAKMGDEGAAIFGMLKQDYGVVGISKISASLYPEIKQKVDAL